MGGRSPHQTSRNARHVKNVICIDDTDIFKHGQPRNRADDKAGSTARLKAICRTAAGGCNPPVHGRPLLPRKGE